MACDQNSIPKDLRPINIARINAEESRIMNPGRISEGFYPNLPRSDITSPPSVPLYYVQATSDGKIVSLSSAGPGPVPSQGPSGPQVPMVVSTPVASPSPPSIISPSGNVQSPSSAVQSSEDGGEDSVSGRKVKFLCSFGGKVMPRPSDGMLRYVGGQTRIITVRRDISFVELAQKMMDDCGQPVVVKYQLPDEDLDALVSVSCPDDLENMMDEYEKLVERSPDGSVKLRVFLFSASEVDTSAMLQFGDLQDSGKKYVDAVNGVLEVRGMTRKESFASVASTQNSDLSVADAADTSLLGQEVSGPSSTNVVSPRSDTAAISEAAIRSGRVDNYLANLPEASGAPLVVSMAPSPSQFVSSQPETLLERTMPLPVQQPVAVKIPSPSSQLQGLMDFHQDTINSTEYQKPPSQLLYTNPTKVVPTPRPLLVQPQFHDNVTTVAPQQFIPVTQMTMAPPSSNLSMNPSMFPTSMQSQRLVAVPADHGYNAYRAQVPGGVAGYGWNQVLPKQEHVPFSEGWTPQQQLPHAHSDPVVQQVSTPTPDVNTTYHSLRVDDIARFRQVNKVVVPSQADMAGVSKNAEGDRIVSDPPRTVVPQGITGGPIQTNYPVATDSIQSHQDDAALKLVPPISHRVNPMSGMMEHLQISQPEILSGTEQIRFPVDQQSQQMAGIEQLANIGFSKPAAVPELNTTHAVPARADLQTVLTNKNAQPIMAVSNLIGNAQESANWNFLQESHFPPPRPTKIMTRAPAPRDILLENPLVSFMETNTQGYTMDLVNQPLNHMNMDHISEQALSNKESQATAEGVAASVLQPALTCQVDVSASNTNHEKELQNNNDNILQAKLEVTRGMNVKPEKANPASPLADDRGRLQVIKNSDLEELRELGSGTFGTVYHGKWRGTDVAIKRINERCFAGKPSEEEKMRDDFWNEASKLADLHHPNVVAFYGVVLDGPGGSVATVTEYMVNGSLRTALEKNERSLDKRKRLIIAMDVAFGMEYLHSRNIVHFDLKSDNLLVNLRDPHRPICKVGDLGLSKVKCQTLISGGVRGTLPWMAPELLNGSSSLVSEKVDVFSFGIVMWELLTGDEPYADLHYGAIIGGIVSNTLRPTVPENCDPDWRMLMERCWSAEPLERPSFTQITDALRSMAAKTPPPKGQATASNARANA